MSRASDITAVIEQGHRSRTQRIDFYWTLNALGHPRLGVIVPRFGATAVARNQLRRRLREIARRRLLPALAPMDVVMRARPAAYAAATGALMRDLVRWQPSPQN